MAEYWDLLDRSGRPLGRTHLRGHPLAPGEYHRVVEIWTVTPGGQILLTLRAPEKEFPLKWENTGGSALCGESSLEAAMRELREETGITARPEELTRLATYMADDIGGIFDVYTVCKAVRLEDIVLQPGETVDARLVSRETLSAMMADGSLAWPIALRFQSYGALFDSLLNIKCIL